MQKARALAFILPSLLLVSCAKAPHKEIERDDVLTYLERDSLAIAAFGEHLDAASIHTWAYDESGEKGIVLAGYDEEESIYFADTTFVDEGEEIHTAAYLVTDEEGEEVVLGYSEEDEEFVEVEDEAKSNEYKVFINLTNLSFEVMAQEWVDDALAALATLNGLEALLDEEKEPEEGDPYLNIIGEYYHEDDESYSFGVSYEYSVIAEIDEEGEVTLDEEDESYVAVALTLTMTKTDEGYYFPTYYSNPEKGKGEIEFEYNFGNPLEEEEE